MIIKFFVYGIIGWVLEIIWTGLGSALNGDSRMVGTTYLWMLPIYGSAVFLEPIHNSIRFMAWPLRACVWLVLIWTIEFMSGVSIKKITGRCPWDYSDSAYSVGGLIRLDYALPWMGTGFLFEIVHDFLASLPI